MGLFESLFVPWRAVVIFGLEEGLDLFVVSLLSFKSS